MNEKKVQIEDEDAVSINLVYRLVNKKCKIGPSSLNDDSRECPGQGLPAEVFDNRCILDPPDLTS